MSTHALRCTKCNQVCVYDRHAPFGSGEEAMFGVVWSCPEGHGQTLDLCPVGPLVPTASVCLNCGAEYTPDDVCPACGLTKQTCLASLGLSTDGDTEPFSAARSAFEHGLFRHGLALLNRAIRDGKASPEAWFGKSRFLHSIGYNRTAAEMMEAAALRYDSSTIKIEFLEEASFLWAECGRGDDALRSADMANSLGSSSIRTHYLRGRALALIGRLEEAREEMLRVLALDPENPDARRGKEMIDTALGPTAPKPWWKLW